MHTAKYIMNIYIYSSLENLPLEVFDKNVINKVIKEMKEKKNKQIKIYLKKKKKLSNRKNVILMMFRN